MVAQAQVLLVLLGGLTVALAVGPCTVCVEPVECFDFDEFSNTKEGIWSYKMVPDAPKFEDISWAFQASEPLAEKDVYWTILYMGTTCGGVTMLGNQIRAGTTPGTILCKPFRESSTTLLTATMLAYEPGCFAMYYICNEKAEECDYDYRFVLANGELTDEHRCKIQEIEDKYNFKGCMKEVCG